MVVIAALAGLCVAYPGMPPRHHLLHADGYYCIGDSANFFTRNIRLQALTSATAALLALGFTHLRTRPE